MKNFIVENDQKIGVMLSGGLDSAIMFYLLIKHNPKSNIQCFTIPKKDGAINYADPIIEHYNNKFKTNFSKTITVGNPNVYHRYQSTTAVIDIFKNYVVDILYIGINKNPPELENLPGAPVRDSESKDSRIIFPFSGMLKSDILKILFDEKQEHLINLTHSCTEQVYGRCMNCWQCKERMWAFSKLNKIDTGVR